MDLAICSLASGSSGNCYLVRTPSAAVLVDAGISARQVKLRLEAMGLSLDDISAVLITHEHADHVKSLEALAKKTRAAICMSRGTYGALDFELDEDRLMLFSSGESFEIAGMDVKSFALSHDAAEPVSYSFGSGGRRLVIITDTGVVTEEIFEEAKDADILVLESNHDVNILRVGRYPWFLKMRILGERGHLSNDSAAELLLRIAQEEAPGTEKERIVLLAHLSQENNFPEMALATVSNELSRCGYIAGKRLLIETLSRTEQSPLYWV
ncbi:MAG: MBL fold metallo-hydrolase [Firmicutes bacterium]|nr:MBL fold metallo-hydrolase [Bacillota bacterium]